MALARCPPGARAERCPRRQNTRLHGARADREVVRRLLSSPSMLVRGAFLDAIQGLLLGSMLLSGCAYQADSFSYSREPFRGVYVSVSCLDMAIEHRKQPNRSDVLAFAFGNRCDDPAVVDLAAARVYGHTADGAAVKLFAFDPFKEIRLMRIDGRAVGREAIEYPSNKPLADVCIDVASIAHAAPARWVCFNK